MRRSFRALLSVMIGFVLSGSVAAEPWTVAMTGKFPPFSYYDARGDLAGFDVDVSREIAKRLNRPLRVVTVEWDGILAGLLGGKYDAIVSSMAITRERAQKVRFSNPYYHSGAQLFVHRDNPAKVYAVEECAGLKVAAVLGETYQRFVEEKYPDVEIVTLKSSVELFELLAQHRITGFVTDRLVGAWQIKSAERPFVPVGDMLYSEEMAIPVRMEDTALLEQINAALKAMREDGSLAAIHDRYFGLGGLQDEAPEEMPTRVIAWKLTKGFAVTLAIAAMALAIGFVLAVPVGVLLNLQDGVWALPRFLARTVVDFLRGTPVLIQLLFAYFGLGLSPWIAAVGTLGINAMAYMAEVVRSGLMSVDPGQARAAQALGLTRPQAFRLIIWPQAFRIAIPALMNSVVALTKDTALISVISIAEVIREAQAIISVTFEPHKYYLIAAVLFFAVTFPLMKLAGRLEQRIKEKGFAHD